MYKTKAAYNSGMASRYRAAQTRLAKFEEAGSRRYPWSSGSQCGSAEGVRASVRS
jgi:hypothetical protein